MYAVTRDDSQAVAAAPIWRGGADAEAEKKTIREGGREPIKIWFGGSYRECWSQDYALTVVYGDRRYVLAERGRDGRWSAAGGDEALAALLASPDCPALTRDYFRSAAAVYSAAHDCLERGLPLDRLGECFAGDGGALEAPELMRLLMDDCGFSLDEAYQTAARCGCDLHADSVDVESVYALQPRTAHVVSILRGCRAGTLAVAHDGRKKEFRSPSGAIEAGGRLTLSFRVLGGAVKAATLVLYGDRLCREFPMARRGDSYTASIDVPDTPAALWYLFRINSASSSQWLCPDGGGYLGRLYGYEAPGFRLTVYKKGFDTPEWFRRSVMYQIFPDRFAFSGDGTAARGVAYHRALGQTPELHASTDEPVRYLPRPFESAYSPDDFYGGTLRGIEDRLPYLKELGVSALYLNPIVESRSNHRYDSSDYLKVDPILGKNEDLTSLCAQAEKLGIRVILDGVFSHTGADSVYFNSRGGYPDLGACQGETSPYYEWYDFRRFPDDYRCWWGFKDLPEVNERVGSWQRFVISGEDSVVKTWLRRGASGWRLDVADELPDDVLALIRGSAKAEKPDALILGEVWEDAVLKESYGGRRNYALGYSLDTVMNYPFRAAMLDFIHRRTDAYALRDFLIAQQMNYPAPMYYSLMNLLGTHDVERLRSALATDAVIRELPRERQLELEFSEEALQGALELEALCAAVQFALPGVPSIYYGDEQGMCGVCDPFNRLPFKEGSRELHDCYAALAKLRNGAAALSTGFAEFAAASGEVLLILRWTSGGRDAFGAAAADGAYLAVINRGDSAARFTADCSAAGRGGFDGCIAARSAEIYRL